MNFLKYKKNLNKINEIILTGNKTKRKVKILKIFWEIELWIYLYFFFLEIKYDPIDWNILWTVKINWKNIVI